jgi:hypothetical protein
MSATQVDYILHDCFFAVGQAVGRPRHVDLDALAWWRQRYREAFQRAMDEHANSWPGDRQRLTAVGRFLGQRALHHAGEHDTIDLVCAQRASSEVEQGCRMRAQQDGIIAPSHRCSLPFVDHSSGACTASAGSAF